MTMARARSTLPWRAAIVVAFLAAASGCGDDSETAPSASLDPVLAARLQTQLDQSRHRYQSLGAVVGVQMADGAVWIGASGSATADQTVALRTTDRFRVG